MLTRSRTGFFALLALLLGLTGCTTNPTTGRSQLALISRNQAIALGEQSKGKLTEEMGGKVADTQVQGYVSEIGMNLKQHTEADNPSLPWEFTLLDSDVINAFALPGGKVFISRGLAEKLTNEAQLASILGHEIGHVTAAHVNERANRMLGMQLGMIGVAVLTKGKTGTQAIAQDAGKVMQLVALKFDRNQETEADALGIRYMTRAGYNPIGSLQGMQAIASGSKGGRPPEFFSTHPHPETRVKLITGWLQNDYPGSLADPNKNVYAERYTNRMLGRVLGMERDEANIELADAFIADVLGDAKTWCAHCREAEEGTGD